MVFGYTCAVDFWENKRLDLANVEADNINWVVRVFEFILSQYLVSILDIGQTEEVFPSFLEVGIGFKYYELLHVTHGHFDLFRLFYQHALYNLVKGG